MEGVTPGRIVHFFHPQLRGPRAALIVQVWGDSGVANLTVFPDWQNDAAFVGYNTYDGKATAWATSVRHRSEAERDGNLANAIYWDWPTQ